MTKIKICGLRRPEDIIYVNECKPDYVGFVFAKSRRQVTEDEAKLLRSALAPGIIPVGVFVNEDIDKVTGLLNEGIIDIAQLHGDEDSTYIARLREKMQRGELIKAVRVASSESIEAAGKLNVDYLLLDTYSAKEYGGTGETFDWSVIQEVGKPFFLAGGISSDNICQAIEAVQPYGVDVSSGVETDGVKDREKIIDIITKVK